jgi:hypothetical protein
MCKKEVLKRTLNEVMEEVKTTENKGSKEDTTERAKNEGSTSATSRQKETCSEEIGVPHGFMNHVEFLNSTQTSGTLFQSTTTTIDVKCRGDTKGTWVIIELQPSSYYQGFYACRQAIGIVYNDELKKKKKTER